MQQVDHTPAAQTSGAPGVDEINVVPEASTEEARFLPGVRTGSMHAMPLLLLDLDNTLLPRDTAFRAWAEGFLREFGLPPSDLDWLTVMDGGGYVPEARCWAPRGAATASTCPWKACSRTTGGG